jgi:hypothetical protein
MIASACGGLCALGCAQCAGPSLFLETEMGRAPGSSVEEQRLASCWSERFNGPCGFPHGHRHAREDGNQREREDALHHGATFGLAAAA